jgi:hypothetical protein
MNRLTVLLLGLTTALGVSAPAPPVDTAGRPRIVKLGTIDCDLVETTPIVFKQRVYRFERRLRPLR